MNATSEKPINLYLVLDITPGASQNEILHAYNRAKNTYSDNSVASYAVFDSDSKDEILHEIEQAFETLGNPARRRDYDLKMGFQTWKGEDSVSSSSTNRQTTDLLEKKRSLAVVKPAETFAEEKFHSDPELEKKIADCKELSGAFLKEVRQYRKLSEDDLARMTRLSIHHVRTIEAEDAQGLHHPTYLRGHVTLICQHLDIPNARELAGTFLDRLKALGKLGQSNFSL